MSQVISRSLKLLPLERQALSAALNTPNHTLRRSRGGYISLDFSVRSSGPAAVHAFTGRVMNRLWRRGYIEYDEPASPTCAKLTSLGKRIATAVLQEKPTGRTAAMKKAAARHVDIARRAPLSLYAGTYCLKQQASAQIAADIARFEKAGGRIEHLSPDAGAAPLKYDHDR